LKQKETKNSRTIEYFPQATRHRDGSGLARGSGIIMLGKFMIVCFAVFVPCKKNKISQKGIIQNSKACKRTFSIPAYRQAGIFLKRKNTRNDSP
jgi:hypothetical protein